MKDVTTIQISKSTLEYINKKKLQYEAKLGKRLTLEEYIKGLLKDE